MVTKMPDRGLLARLRGEAIAGYCREHHIVRLSLFGSALQGELKPDSDVDLLVEFDPVHIPTLLDMARMESELSGMLGGRKVDLRTYEDLSCYFRDDVVASSVVVYAEA
jgi:predicted nucleotidyltransferase